MLSHELWRDRFGADPAAVGGMISIDGELCSLIGVLPADFHLPSDRDIDLLRPLALHSSSLRHSGGGSMKILRGVGRLWSGVALAQAEAELSLRLAASRALDPPLYDTNVSLRVVPLHEYAVRDARSAALVLMGAVAAILLMAAANIANLLVRAAGRTREVAIRVAFGAAPVRIARHLLVEGFLLCASGCAAGLVLARLLVRLLQRMRPAVLTQAGDAVIDSHVLAAVLGASPSAPLRSASRRSYPSLNAVAPRAGRR